MKEIYKSLFTPFKIGNVKIKNRFVTVSYTHLDVYKRQDQYGRRSDRSYDGVDEISVNDADRDRIDGLYRRRQHCWGSRQA